MFRIIVRAKVKAQKNAIIQLDEHTYKIAVTEAPEDNKANLAIIKIIADYFSVPTSAVHIAYGRTSNRKIIEIMS